MSSIWLLGLQMQYRREEQKQGTGEAATAVAQVRQDGASDQGGKRAM